MKKILFAIYNINNGGAERSLVNLLSEIDPKKYEIDLLLFAREGLFLSQIPEHVNIVNGSDILHELYTKCPSRKNICIKLYKYLSTGVSYIAEKTAQSRGAFRWLKFYSKLVPNLEKKYDIAVAYLSRDIMYYVADKVTASQKYVFVHNDYVTAGHPKKYDLPYFEKMDKLITISNTCADVLKDEFPQFKKKIVNLPNITSSAAIRCRAKDERAIELEGCSNTKILSVGRLNQQKGFDMAISAAAIMKSKGYKFHWFIMGGGELENSLKKQIADLQVEDSIFLIGVRENPYSYMLASDIIAQTSRWEGKSVALDEAKIIGTPILTTNYPTAKDQIKDGKEGIIVDMTPDAIADGLIKLIEDRELRDRIQNYLLSHEYGNVSEMEKYYKLFG